LLSPLSLHDALPIFERCTSVPVSRFTRASRPDRAASPLEESRCYVQKTARPTLRTTKPPSVGFSQLGAVGLRRNPSASPPMTTSTSSLMPILIGLYSTSSLIGSRQIGRAHV